MKKILLEKFEFVGSEIEWLHVSAPLLYEDKEVRWVWYDSVDRFKVILKKRISEGLDRINAKHTEEEERKG